MKSDQVVAEAAGMMSEMTGVMLRELTQARALLRESVQTLGGAVEGLCAGSRAQLALLAEELVDGAARGNGQGCADAARALTEQVGTDAGRAIECLQFEDVVGQMLDHCSGLVGLAHDLASDLSSLGKNAGSSGGAADNNAALAIRLAALRLELASRLRSPVLRPSSQAGDVDLF